MNMPKIENTGKTIQFRDWKCNVWLSQYQTGHTALVLKNAEPFVEEGYEFPANFEELFIASVNIPDANLKENEIAVKDYSENDGILEVLVRANILKMPHKYIKSGHVDCPVCKLNVKFNN